MTFSPDGKTLATTTCHHPGSGGELVRQPVQLWNLTASHPTPVGGPFAGADDGTASVAFSPDGKILATVNAGAGLGAGYDGQGGPVQLWNIATDHPNPAGRPFAGAGRRHQLGGIQPEQQDTGHRERQRRRRRHSTAVEHDYPPENGQPHLQRHRRVRLSGIQPEQAAPGQGNGDGTVQLWNVARATGLLPSSEASLPTATARATDGIQPQRHDVGHRQPGRQRQ